VSALSHRDGLHDEQRSGQFGVRALAWTTSSGATRGDSRVARRRVSSRSSSRWLLALAHASPPLSPPCSARAGRRLGTGRRHAGLPPSADDHRLRRRLGGAPPPRCRGADPPGCRGGVPHQPPQPPRPRRCRPDVRPTQRLNGRFVELREAMPSCGDPEMDRYTGALRQILDHHVLLLKTSLGFLAAEARCELLAERLDAVDGLGLPARRLEAIRSEILRRTERERSRRGRLPVRARSW
jgi:hypothetical protein